MKNLLLLCFTFFTLTAFSQQHNPAELFWQNLKQHCGQTYEGEITTAPEDNEFQGKKLLMHVRACKENEIRIPFFVGEDRSRTWILRLNHDRIQLKHDHRHEDGSEDEITMYGGTATNHGLEHLQAFPADQETADLLPDAAANVWWITLEDKIFSYNLKRLGTDRLFTVEFDLSTPVETPAAPWGRTESKQ